MKKLGRLFLLWITIFCICVDHSSAAVDQQPDTLHFPEIIPSDNYVLIINFHLESLQWNGNIEDELIKYLHTTNAAQVYSEHIRALDITSQEQLTAEQQRIFDKYPNRPIAVVFIGPAATPFFADAMNNRWPNVPFIDCIAGNYKIPLEKYFTKNINVNFQLSPITDKELQRDYNITGLWAHTALKENVELMREVIPDLNHIVFISDARIGSVVIRHRFRSMIAKNFPGISVDFLNGGEVSTKELMDKVSSYDNRTGIIFHTWAVKGSGSEDYYIWNNLYKMIGGSASVPVFVFWDMNIETGAVAGGYCSRMKDISTTAIELLKKVLSGTDPRTIPFQSSPKAHAYLSYPYLSNFHSIKIQYPKEAVYFNKPQNVFYIYRYEFTVIGMILLLVILYGIQRIHYLGRDKKKREEELAKQFQLQQQIGLRNFKLALALEVSTVNPWVWNLKENQVYLDNVKKMIDSPNSCDTASVRSGDTFMSWIKEVDRDRMQQIFNNIRNGKANYLKEDCRMCLPSSQNDKFEWYMMQAIVYEKDNYGKPITLIGTTTLITETKDMELQLIQARDAAEESSRLKSRFLANLSHEIRTPLNAIVGFSGVLVNAEDQKERRELADIVEYNNKLLLHLINDILDISKIESGSVDFTYTNVEINTLLTSIKESFDQEVNDKVEIILEPALDACSLHTEKRRLKQVINNLMSNAVKFTKQGTIRLGYYAPEKDKIRFYVKDTGCGIPQEQLTSIFGRFVKLNNFEQGTGLGLSIAQLIVEKLKGEIGVYSEFRIGSEFWFDIPYTPAITERKIDVNVLSDTYQTPIIKILVAEDMQSNYMVLQSMLDQECVVYHAWNGKEAVEMYQQYRPDLILMDIKMPVMDGYSAVAEIRKLSSTVPIVAISAYGFDDDGERMRKSGFNDYQSKPIDRIKLRKLISKLSAEKKGTSTSAKD